LRFDDDNRNDIGINDDVEDQAVCEQDNQNLRYEMSHANSRPAGEDVGNERGTEDDSGDETGSDDDGEVVFNPRQRLRQLWVMKWISKSDLKRRKEK